MPVLCWHDLESPFSKEELIDAIPHDEVYVTSDNSNFTQLILVILVV